MKCILVHVVYLEYTYIYIHGIYIHIHILIYEYPIYIYPEAWKTRYFKNTNRNFAGQIYVINGNYTYIFLHQWMIPVWIPDDVP